MANDQNSSTTGGENANGGDASRPENSDLELEKEYLRESVRLAEVKLEKLAESKHVLDKKAILIMTLCVVIIGFILSTGNISVDSSIAHLESKKNCFPENMIFIATIILCTGFLWLLKLTSCILLTVGAFYGARVVDLAKAGIAGFRPAVTQHFSDYAENNQRAMIEMHTYILKKYEDRIAETANTHDNKLKELKTARRLLIAGVISAIIWGIFNFFLLDAVISTARYAVISLACCQ